MEKLMALYTLWALEIGTERDFVAELNRLRQGNLDDPFLMGMADFIYDIEFARICITSTIGIKIKTKEEIDKFGKELLAGLEKAYKKKKISRSNFCDMCYRTWSILPKSFKNEYPFKYLWHAMNAGVFDKEFLDPWFQRIFDYYKERE